MPYSSSNHYEVVTASPAHDKKRVMCHVGYKYNYSFRVPNVV